MYNCEGFTITTPNGIGENGETYFVYRIYKAEPLTSLETDETFFSAKQALDAGIEFVYDHLHDSGDKWTARRTHDNAQNVATVAEKVA